MPFLGRTRRGPDRYLTWKTILLFVGVGMLLVGVRLELHWLRWSAITILLIAFVLRFLPHETPAERSDDA